MKISFRSLNESVCRAAGSGFDGDGDLTRLLGASGAILISDGDSVDFLSISDGFCLGGVGSESTVTEEARGVVIIGVVITGVISGILGASGCFPIIAGELITKILLEIRGNF